MTTENAETRSWVVKTVWQWNWSWHPCYFHSCNLTSVV